jgi:hypothetical protein
MFGPAWNNPYDFDASSSGDLTLPPPTMLTEDFVAAHTEVLCQLLQAQQRMAQQLQQMPPMQQEIQPSKPYAPEVPTQSDINAIVGATQLLEGQNSMLNQMVYDIIVGDPKLIRQKESFIFHHNPILTPAKPGLRKSMQAFSRDGLCLWICGTDFSL